MGSAARYPHIEVGKRLNMVKGRKNDEYFTPSLPPPSRFPFSEMYSSGNSSLDSLPSTSSSSSSSCPSSPSSSTSDLPLAFANFSKREYLLAQIKQKDAIIESLLKQLHNPYIATPMSIASYRMATSPSDQNNKNILEWLDRLQSSVRSAGGKGGPNAFKDLRTSKLEDEDSDVEDKTHAQRFGLAVAPEDDDSQTVGGEESTTVNDKFLPDSDTPLGLIANLSLSNNKSKGKKNVKDIAAAEESLDDDDVERNVLMFVISPKKMFGDAMPNSWPSQGPATDLGIRATLIEQHSPPEILVHGLVTPADVDALFDIFFKRVNLVICAISSRYYAEKSEIYPIAMHFAKHSAASALIDGWKSVELCQAYILMSIYAVPARRWEEDRSWLYTGLAIRIATDLNLHQVPNIKPQNEKQEREILNRTRVWMICFNLDRSTATQFGKPSTIKEDYIMRNAKEWYKKSKYNLPYDVHLCAYSALLRIMAKSHDEIFSDPSSPSGLNKRVDFRSVTMNHDVQLTRYQDEWTRRFSETSDPNDPGCAFRCSLLPFLVGYSRLVMFSFGFQQAYQRGIEPGDHVYFNKCLDSAKSVIRNMVENLATTGYMRYAPDGISIFMPMLLSSTSTFSMTSSQTGSSQSQGSTFGESSFQQDGKMDTTPIYQQEATFSSATGEINFGTDLGISSFGGSMSDEEMLATMQALKNPAWWENMMMPGFSWPEPASSPSSNGNSPPASYPPPTTSYSPPVAYPFQSPNIPGIPGIGGINMFQTAQIHKVVAGSAPDSRKTIPWDELNDEVKELVKRASSGSLEGLQVLVAWMELNKHTARQDRLVPILYRHLQNDPPESFETQSDLSKAKFALASLEGVSQSFLWQLSPNDIQTCLSMQFFERFWSSIWKWINVLYRRIYSKGLFSDLESPLLYGTEDYRFVMVVRSLLTIMDASRRWTELLQTPGVILLLADVWFRLSETHREAIHVPNTWMSITVSFTRVLENEELSETVVDGFEGDVSRLALLMMRNFRALFNNLKQNDDYLRVVMPLTSFISTTTIYIPKLSTALLSHHSMIEFMRALAYYVDKPLSKAEIQDFLQSYTKRSCIWSTLMYVRTTAKITDGYTWLAQAVRSQLIPSMLKAAASFTDGASQFKTGRDPALLKVTNIVSPHALEEELISTIQILSMFLVYRSYTKEVERAMSDPLIPLLESSIPRTSPFWEAWSRFKIRVQDRIIIKQSFDSSGKYHVQCSAPGCSKQETNVYFKLCSACQTTAYCSKACQANDWRAGIHKQRCRETQRDRLEGTLTPISEHDGQFIHYVADCHVRRHAAEIVRVRDDVLARNPWNEIVIYIDYNRPDFCFIVDVPDAFPPFLQTQLQWRPNLLKDTGLTKTYLIISAPYGKSHQIYVLGADMANSPDFWVKRVLDHAVSMEAALSVRSGSPDPNTDGQVYTADIYLPLFKLKPPVDQKHSEDLFTPLDRRDPSELRIQHMGYY
ncbi:hypothetical protein H0H93_005986 [Arthromyces matolae]|nr:hypothetical protein H0H93_005986 [Arthromyces matolae]